MLLFYFNLFYDGLFVFIYSMMVQMIYKYVSFWQEISKESLILEWSLKVEGLLFVKMCINTSSRWIERWFFMERNDARG